MVECGVSTNTLKDAKKKESRCWSFMKDPQDARKVLIDYAELKPVYKEMIERRFGNPYEHVARTPILNMVVNDYRAHDYFLQYRYYIASGIPGRNEEKKLPIGVVNKYTRAAAWLELVVRVMQDKKLLNKELGLGVTEFYTQASILINLDRERGKLKEYGGLDVLPGDFPSSYQRLMNKARTYEDKGFESIIASEFGNKLAAKLGKVTDNNKTVKAEQRVISAPKVTGKAVVSMPVLPEKVEKSEEIVPKSANKQGAFALELYHQQMAVIRRCSEFHNNLDAAQVAKMANVVFETNGWETVSVETVRKIIAENEALLTAARHGKRAHDTNIGRQVKRKVTELPLVYWTLDGWTVELLYQERGPKGIEYKRMVVVVVLDVWTKYPIGYAIGPRETPELIRQANRNALLHVQELFGKVYHPLQVQSDRYALKNLTPFYQAMTHLHTPAAVGNAKAKVIEPYFKYLNKEYCQLTPNWTGFNVTARKETQVNIEMTDKIKHSFPDMDGVTRQIEQIMQRERAQKADQYVSTWGDLDDKYKQEMGVMEWLEVFGQAVGATNKITGEGLVKQIDTVKYVYDTLDPDFRRNIHLDWQVYADPTDLTRVLVKSPDANKRFVLEQVREVPMDILSTTDEDREHLKLVRDYNKAMKADIAELYGHDADVTRAIVEATPLDLSNEDELALKLMLTTNGQQKNKLQDAKKLIEKPRKEEQRAEVMRADEWQARQEARLNQVFDFSIFNQQ